VPPVRIAEVVRSGVVESVHYGSVVAVTGTGEVLVDVGDTDTVLLPRSANKFVQAAAMVRAGLAVRGELLALAASSHSGEPFHREGVRAILHGAGLDETALQNTPDLPSGADERRWWIREGRAAESIAQGCSGKHAAMVATCVAAGWSVSDYLHPDHPLQQEIATLLGALSGDPITATAVDGCGAPAHAITLHGLARSFAAVATADAATPEGTVAAAVRAYPRWVGGTGRDVTLLMEAVPGLIAKDGAEAVYAAALPDGRAAAVKVSDGGSRAGALVLVEALRVLGVPNADIAFLADKPVFGHGTRVGSVLPVRLGS
jgi:L-asparaginase II